MIWGAHPYFLKQPYVDHHVRHILVGFPTVECLHVYGFGRVKMLFSVAREMTVLIGFRCSSATEPLGS